jgi:hypothetical protein
MSVLTPQPHRQPPGGIVIVTLVTAGMKVFPDLLRMKSFIRRNS